MNCYGAIITCHHSDEDVGVDTTVLYRIVVPSYEKEDCTTRRSNQRVRIEAATGKTAI